MTDRATAPPVSGLFRVAESIVRPAVTITTSHTWTGIENLPRSGGFVVSPNHMTHVDPFLVAHFLVDNGCPPFFLAKEELFHIPLAGWLLRGAGQIPVYRRSQRAVDAYRDALTAVSEGRCVVIYPEGTLTKDPNLWPMPAKTGAARVALTEGVPVVPVAHWGDQLIVGPRAGRWGLMRRRHVSVTAGPPVDLDDLRERPLDSSVLREATTRIMRDVTALLAELRDEVPPGGSEPKHDPDTP